MSRKDDDDMTTPFIKEDGKEPAASKAAEPPKGKAMAAPAGTAPPLAMFRSFKAAKNIKMPKWAIPLLAAAGIFHAVLFITMWVKTIWEIEQLERPKGGLSDLAIAPPPPPPPPPPPGGVKPQTQVITPKKIRVRDIVQPVKIEKQEVQPQVVESGDPDGVEGGEEGGVSGGVVQGVGAAPPPPPPPPPPAPPQNVPPTLLEGSRIAGDKNIIPDDVTKTEIQRSGKDKIVGSYKLCLSIDGNVSAVNQLKSTGFGAYDAKIQREMRSWRYRAYMVNGKAVPVCTAVTFIYSQK
jgi:periplasmic protein TonB